MSLRIRFRHMNTSDALSHAVNEKIYQPVKHLCPEATSVVTIMDADDSTHKVHCHVSMPGRVIAMNAEGDDMYGVISELAQKLTRRVRKFRERRRDVRRSGAVPKTEDEIYQTVAGDAVDAEDILEFERSKARSQLFRH